MSESRIETAAEHEECIAEVEQYFIDQPEPGSEREKRFLRLCRLIEEYEAIHYPILPPEEDS